MRALIFDLDGTLVDTVYAHVFACQRKMGVEPGDCYVVGDAVWDLLGARRAGAFRVYVDPLELHRSLDELGVLP